MMENDALPLSYLRRLTDDTGIFQHTKFGVADRSHGYTSDDNARALIAAVLAYAKRPSESGLDLAHTYLSFLYHAQNPDGSFRNFMNYDRSFAETVGSDDCQGRCLWALGSAITETGLPDNLQNTCKYMLDRALPHLEQIRSPRAIGYALIGLTSILESPDALFYAFPYMDAEKPNPDFLSRARIEALIDAMANKLNDSYTIYRKDDWHWYEDSLTYGNAMLPWAMLKVSRLPGKEAYAPAARESLDFLIKQTFADEGHFKPIGSGGWYTRNGTPALYDEQPIEASETMFACLEAYRRFGAPAYHEFAVRCYEWFHGANSLKQSLIDPQTGGCYDGIHAQGLNLNQGSENIISYCMAQAVILPLPQTV
ncbi:glycosyl transferase [Saccharibacillus kuerlensis]|nr:glycosyl transferase [Saccharibacillus kuerlensis]